MLEVLRWPGRKRRRRYVKSSGVSPQIDLRVYNQDIDTLERAVKERVFFVGSPELGFSPPPLPGPMAFERLLLPAFDALRKYLPRAAPLTYDEFVLTFQGRKRVLYQRACDSLLGQSFVPRDATIRTFVKFEKINFSKNKSPVPRVISPRNPRYNVELGLFLRPIESRIYRAIRKLFGHETVIKGYNALDSARLMREKWDFFAEPVAIGIDAKRFDQHVSQQALRWEHSVYTQCYPCTWHKRKLQALLDYQLRNKCTAYLSDGKARYTTIGGRMSGDMNTSLGNCLLMCSILYAYATVQRVTIQLANNGDDCVVFMERRFAQRFRAGLHEYFLSLGFSVIAEPDVYTFEAIEFCQSHPVLVEPSTFTFIMVRNPELAIAKDCVAIKPWFTPKQYLGWIKAVGEGGLSLTGGIPIFQEFYATLDRFGVTWGKIEEFRNWGALRRMRGVNAKYRHICDGVRASFYYAFGITPDEQLCIEAFYRSVVVSTKPIPVFEYQPPMPF